MNEMISIAIVMEMLLVNLFTVDVCASRKYSGLKTVSILFLFTFVLTALTNGLWKYMGFDKGNAFFAVIGVLYLLPLAFLYQQRLRHIQSILFSAWIYTMLVYCISVQIAYILSPSDLVRNVLLIQSGIYVLTFYFFIYWVKKGFLFILKNISQNSRYFLQLVSLGWFVSIIIINAGLIYTQSELLKLAVIVTLTVNALFSYLLIYSLVKSHQEVRTLEDIVYIDPLTHLLNRAKLFRDVPLLIEKKHPFRLFFMDLNRFKSVNDQYGHRVGDKYLVCFAQATARLLKDCEQLYRMSGDEFVIVSQAQDFEELTRALQAYPKKLADLEIPFLGFGLGWADYPAEGTTLDKLISLADHRMYENKRTVP